MEVNLVSLVEKFRSEDACRSYLERLRWPDGVECSKCKSKSISDIATRSTYQCLSCSYQFSVTVGTIFGDTHLPLWKWFLGVYLMCESKKGISARQLERTLGVAHKTGWYLSQRIRAAMGDVSDQQPLTGTVEADETWVGGKRRHVGSGYVENKTQVLAAIQRGGEIRLTVHERGQRADAATLHGFLKAVVHDDATAIYTDENPGYAGIGDANTVHATVDHHAEEWVRGDVHTNTAESAWSLLKRSIIGSYHQLSTKHLDSYLGEFEWRFNNRENPYLFRDTLIRLLAAETLPYKRLTA